MNFSKDVFIFILALNFSFLLNNHSQSVIEKPHSKEKDFHLISAARTIVYPGVSGGFTNINYHIEFVAKKSNHFQFDSLWVDGYRLKVFTSRNSDSVKEGDFQLNKGDTIKLEAHNNYRQQLSKKGIAEVLKKTIKNPFDNEGEATLRYKEESSVGYYVIKSFTKKRINIP